MTENSYLPKKTSPSKKHLEHVSRIRFSASSAQFEFSDVFQRSYFRPVVRRLDIEIGRHSFRGTFVASSTFVAGIFILVLNSGEYFFSFLRMLGFEIVSSAAVYFRIDPSTSEAVQNIVKSQIRCLPRPFKNNYSQIRRQLPEAIQNIGIAKFVDFRGNTSSEAVGFKSSPLP